MGLVTDFSKNCIKFPSMLSFTWSVDSTFTALKSKCHLVSWCGNFMDPQSFGRITQNSAKAVFQQNFRIKKLGEIIRFYAVIWTEGKIYWPNTILLHIENVNIFADREMNHTLSYLLSGT